MLPAKPDSIYQASRCTISHDMRGEPDEKSHHSKAKMSTAFKNLHFIHNVDIVLPNEGWSEKLELALKQRQKPRYFKIEATLGQFLEKEFFTEHVKSGNASLISEGKAPAANTFSIHNGMLTMHLAREDYERTGLNGVPDKVNGSRELQPKWVVTYDLRTPSMLHGKKGFDRLMYACNRAICEPTRWICSFNCQPETPKWLEKFPTAKAISPGADLHYSTSLDVPRTVTPEITGIKDRQCATENATELYEWLSLVRLGSPRISHGDSIDPYLSRYKVPGDLSQQLGTCCIRWTGLISDSWFWPLLTELRAACPSGSWFALSATEIASNGLGSGDEVAALRLPDSVEQYIVWEIKQRV